MIKIENRLFMFIAISVITINGYQCYFNYQVDKPETGSDGEIYIDINDICIIFIRSYMFYIRAFLFTFVVYHFLYVVNIFYNLIHNLLNNH